MAEDIKNLIEKIQEEGVKVAESKAREIENEARRRAEQIVQDARVKAERLIDEAKERLSKMEEKQKTLLTQAGRDLLLVLRKEIDAMLEKLILSQVEEVLTADALFKIIAHLVKDYAGKEKGDIIVRLKKEDLEAMEKNFLSKLQPEIEKGIILRASDDIQGGFVISYDGGKSQCDFSDKALADYIGTYLKPKLADILKDATAK